MGPNCRQFSLRYECRGRWTGDVGHSSHWLGLRLLTTMIADRVSAAAAQEAKSRWMTWRSRSPRSTSVSPIVNGRSPQDRPFVTCIRNVLVWSDIAWSDIAAGPWRSRDQIYCAKLRAVTHRAEPRLTPAPQCRECSAKPSHGASLMIEWTAPIRMKYWTPILKCHAGVMP